MVFDDFIEFDTVIYYPYAVFEGRFQSSGNCKVQHTVYVRLVLYGNINRIGKI